jgi:hypothetical protein
MAESAAVSAPLLPFSASNYYRFRPISERIPWTYAKNAERFGEYTVQSLSCWKFRRTERKDELVEPIVELARRSWHYALLAAGDDTPNYLSEQESLTKLATACRAALVVRPKNAAANRLIVLD